MTWLRSAKTVPGVRLAVQRLYPETVLESAVRTMLVPVRRLPQSAGSRCGILNCWPGAAKSSSRYSPTWRERPCEKGFPVFRRLVSVSAVILGAGVPEDGGQADGAYDARTSAEDCPHRRAAVAGY